MLLALLPLMNGTATVTEAPDPQVPVGDEFVFTFEVRESQTKASRHHILNRDASSRRNMAWTGRSFWSWADPVDAIDDYSYTPSRTAWHTYSWSSQVGASVNVRVNW